MPPPLCAPRQRRGCSCPYRCAVVPRSPRALYPLTVRSRSVWIVPRCFRRYPRALRTLTVTVASCSGSFRHCPHAMRPRSARRCQRRSVDVWMVRRCLRQCAHVLRTGNLDRGTIFSIIRRCPRKTARYPPFAATDLTGQIGTARRPRSRQSTRRNRVPPR
jgi:hypothetical protein